MGDPERLANKICTYFDVPPGEVQGPQGSEDYTVPPAPKCIQRKMFLPVPYLCLPCQDYHLKQPWRTLAYAQAIQYWAEKANLLGPDKPHYLVMCVHELRWAMKPYTTFSNCDVFKGLTCKTSEVGVEETVQPNPTESTLVDDPATLITRPSAVVDESATLITTPSIPAEKSVALITTPAVLVDKPADPTALPEKTTDMGKAEDLEYPKWINVHPSHLGASMGSFSPRRPQAVLPQL